MPLLLIKEGVDALDLVLDVHLWQGGGGDRGYGIAALHLEGGVLGVVEVLKLGHSGVVLRGQLLEVRLQVDLINGSHCSLWRRILLLLLHAR